MNTNCTSPCYVRILMYLVYVRTYCVFISKLFKEKCGFNAKAFKCSDTDREVLILRKIQENNQYFSLDSHKGSGHEFDDDHLLSTNGFAG